MLKAFTPGFPIKLGMTEKFVFRNLKKFVNSLINNFQSYQF